MKNKKEDTIINALLQDYEDYLGDLSLKDLNRIAKGGVFTLHEIELEEVDPR